MEEGERIRLHVEADGPPLAMRVIDRHPNGNAAAKAIGVSQGQLSQIVSGKKVCSIEIYAKIARAAK